MAATCGGSRDPRTTPNLLAASAAAFPTCLPKLTDQIRISDQTHVKATVRERGE
jgi:hypothetical protein